MVTISKKNNQTEVYRSNEEDVNVILDFHQKHFKFSFPEYLKSTLKSNTGISVVASQEERLLGHLLLFPLTSKRKIGFERAALIIGIWTLGDNIAEKIIREAIMSAWESGFHVVFSIGGCPQLKKAGFEKVQNSFFSLNASEYKILGMELSWNGFEKIPHDLHIPASFLPPIHELNHFLKN